MKSSKPYKTPNRESWVKVKLRRVSNQWPAWSEAKRRARIRPGVEVCAMCSKEFKVSKRLTHMDHITPIMGLKQETRLPDGKMDWNAYIERLLPEPEGYQVLCIPCHEAKTATEDTYRAKYKKKNKDKLKK